MLPALECPELCNSECDDATSYCDCGSAECKCKTGFYGDNCSEDLCSAARCQHGVCAATYLGGELPVTANACICDDGWSGPLCQYNPCIATSKTCSGHGTCVAASDTEAKCICDAGYSGEDCTESCEDKCLGSYPFGCATDVIGVERYGCHSGGGCNYLKEGEQYPYDGFCTYKSVSQAIECVCGVDNDCELTRSCEEVDGSCSIGHYL